MLLLVGRGSGRRIILSLEEVAWRKTNIFNVGRRSSGDEFLIFEKVAVDDFWKNPKCSSPCSNYTFPQFMNLFFKPLKESFKAISAVTITVISNIQSPTHHSHVRFCLNSSRTLFSSMEVTDEQEDELPEVNFVPCVKFVKRGISAARTIAEVSVL